MFRPATTLGTLLSRGVSAYGRFHLPAAWLIGLKRLIMAALVVYLACLMWQALRVILRSFRLRRLLKLAFPPSPELTRLFEQLREEAGVRRCELQLLPGLTSPGTVYWLRPSILVPENFDSHAVQAQLADVLRHELAHIARRDYLLAALSDTVCALLLFHPAVWYARKRMRLERELACDLAVVEACPDRRADYADTLAHFVRQRVFSQSSVAGVDFAGSPSFLLQRVRCILAEPIRTPLWKKLSAATAVFAMFALFAVYVPALAIVLDFASRPAASPTATQNASPEIASALPPLARARHISLAVAEQPVTYPDDLTTLRVQDRQVEAEEALRASRSGGNTLSGDPEATDSAWRERSPVCSRVPGPSVGSILL
ncbi:MAG TPA: M56 family metallopeptidase, partial [Terriglobales bacterium]|nr:M56 family metallopeptidase [Terriglobales bacterium]